MREEVTAKLSTPWELAQRCEDECASSGEPSVALLVLEQSAGAACEGAEIAETVAGGLRRSDVIAQIGECRYAVLLAGAGRYDAGRVAARIRASTGDVGIGVAVFPWDGGDLGELVVAALASMRGRTSQAA